MPLSHLLARVAPLSHWRENEVMRRPNVDIKALTPEERLTLLEEIWDSLEPEDVRLTEAQRAELDRRLDDLERNPDAGIPWEEVLKQIRERAR
jgi:putative addiction module component (TIGR02574 family)